MEQLQARIKADLDISLDRDEDGQLYVTSIYFDTRSADNGLTLEVVWVTDDGEEVPASDELVEEVIEAIPGKGEVPTDIG